MPRKSADGFTNLSDWASTHQWLVRWLEDKTTPRKILAWTRWARGRMEQGWDRETIERRIRDAWHTHELTHDLAALEEDLKTALQQVYELADKGWTPAQCAVVYRSLYRAHPHRHWLEDWAERWDKAGTDWQAVVMP